MGTRVNWLATTAKTTLTAGPAIPTNIISLRGLFNLEKLTGIGFAQPNKNVFNPKKRNAIKTPGRKMVPTGSTCMSGLSVRRPASFAVGSPSLYATQPWAYSCNTTAKKSITAIEIISRITKECPPVSSYENVLQHQLDPGNVQDRF